MFEQQWDLLLAILSGARPSEAIPKYKIIKSHRESLIFYQTILLRYIFIELFLPLGVHPSEAIPNTESPNCNVSVYILSSILASIQFHRIILTVGGASVGGDSVGGVIVGLAVGDAVGPTVGNGVGDAVGSSIGVAVGLSVGSGTGASVGTDTGAACVLDNQEDFEAQQLIDEQTTK